MPVNPTIQPYQSGESQPGAARLNQTVDPLNKLLREFNERERKDNILSMSAVRFLLGQSIPGFPNYYYAKIITGPHAAALSATFDATATGMPEGYPAAFSQTGKDQIPWDAVALDLHGMMTGQANPPPGDGGFYAIAEPHIGVFTNRTEAGDQPYHGTPVIQFSKPLTSRVGITVCQGPNGETNAPDSNYVFVQVQEVGGQSECNPGVARYTETGDAAQVPTICDPATPKPFIVRAEDVANAANGNYGKTCILIPVMAGNTDLAVTNPGPRVAWYAVGMDPTDNGFYCSTGSGSSSGSGTGSDSGSSSGSGSGSGSDSGSGSGSGTGSGSGSGTGTGSGSGSGVGTGIDTGCGCNLDFDLTMDGCILTATVSLGNATISKSVDISGCCNQTGSSGSSVIPSACACKSPALIYTATPSAGATSGTFSAAWPTKALHWTTASVSIDGGSSFVQDENCGLWVSEEFVMGGYTGRYCLRDSLNSGGWQLTFYGGELGSLVTGGCPNGIYVGTGGETGNSWTIS